MFNPLTFFRKPASRPDSFLALDAGDAAAKVYLFDLSAGPNPVRIKKSALEDGQVVVSNVVAVVDGAHAWLKTTTVKHNRGEEQQPISPEELAELKEKILQTAEMQTTKEVYEFFGANWDLELVDEQWLQFKIDNQITTSPVGRPGKSLEASLFTAFTSTAYIKKLSAELKESGLNLWGVSSRHFLTVKALAQKLGWEWRSFDAIILDIGERQTDVIVVFGGGIWGNRTLFVGARDFAAGEEALAFWVSGIEEALADFEGVKTFPEKIFLVGDGSASARIRDKISAHPLQKTLPFTNVPKVENIEVENERLQVLAAEIAGGQDEN